MATEKKHNKITGYDFVAIIAGVGLIGWISTDFFGGMILWFLSYGVIVAFIVLLYVLISRYFNFNN